MIKAFEELEAKGTMFLSPNSALRSHALFAAFADAAILQIPRSALHGSIGRVLALEGQHTGSTATLFESLSHLFEAGKSQEVFELLSTFAPTMERILIRVKLSLCSTAFPTIG